MSAGALACQSPPSEFISSPPSPSPSPSPSPISGLLQVHKLPPNLLEKREVIYVDIANDAVESKVSAVVM